MARSLSPWWGSGAPAKWKSWPGLKNTKHIERQCASAKEGFAQTSVFWTHRLIKDWDFQAFPGDKYVYVYAKHKKVCAWNKMLKIKRVELAEVEGE